MEKTDVKANSLDRAPNRPFKEWKAGTVQAAVWSNKKDMDDGTEIEFKTVSLTRSYRKKGEDIWRHDTLNLRRNDLQKVILVLEKAQESLLLSPEAGSNE
tara:strand:- start:1160 stop:1459 length:300 start_codon:yes stop_codon:yes gene_type:complete